MLRRPSLLVLAVLAVWGCLASPAAAPAQALTQAQPHRPACSADLPQTSNGAVVLPVADNCTWDIRLDPSTTHVVIEGSRPVLGLYSYASATPAVFAAAGAAPGIAAESPGEGDQPVGAENPSVLAACADFPSPGDSRMAACGSPVC